MVFVTIDSSYGYKLNIHAENKLSIYAMYSGYNEKK